MARVETGDFVPTIKNNILCEATKRKEHSGRVRGYGSFVCQRDLTGRKRVSKPTNASKFKQLEKDMLLTQKWQQKRDLALQLVAKKQGILLPDDLDDITPDWEPPSSGSRHSPFMEEVEVQGGVCPPPEHENAPENTELSTPSTVSFDIYKN